ncbi:hypothetical protein J1N35_001637 [Gossypium stocksii]|uniref:Uncharacterized protein n=1 Tax=Gossypium stocksii TaxID=47602 RepID=A0A9D3WKG7_9ROSI|nr:hypothetical protein J1N35_001637 [Gossypium stocksii]
MAQIEYVSRIILVLLYALCDTIWNRLEKPYDIFQCMITDAFTTSKDIKRGRVVYLCMSSVNDSFMLGSLDHSVRIWDLRVNACQASNSMEYGENLVGLKVKVWWPKDREKY